MDVKYSQETIKFYHYRYVREYLAVALLWALLSIILCVMVIVAFTQPQWIGDTYEGTGKQLAVSPYLTMHGHMGVYRNCHPDSTLQNYVCDGTFVNFDSIINDSFRVVTVFTGLSSLLMLIIVAAMLLFFCFKSVVVFILLGVLEILVSLFMLLAIIIYPSGWDDEKVRYLCGNDVDKYRLGLCGMRWAYIIAILCVVDAFFLGILAFFLASKRAKEEQYTPQNTVTKSEINGYYGDTASKGSGMPIQPIVTVPEPERDRLSDYSHPSQRENRGFQL